MSEEWGWLLKRGSYDPLSVVMETLVCIVLRHNV
nr:MAG TPA: hypothetical protein [Caudoviricetes sp.]